MEKKPKYENLVNFVNLTTEGFTAQRASADENMPNKNTTIHTLNGFEKAGLLSASKNKDGKVFSKTEDWSVEKAITANKARIKAKVEKRKKKPAQATKTEQETKPKQKSKKAKAPKSEAPV